MDMFTQLGEKIESKWRAHHYDERVFSALAVQSLEEANIPEHIGADDILHWLLTSDHLPEQMDIDSKFGEPPVTMYRGRRFEIQVIFWFTASTTIHDHSFSGAFQVLHGSSLHSTYEFHPLRRYTAHFLVGDVQLRGAELCTRGRIIAIDETLQHCLFHLEAPSATIVVRTYRNAEAYPQYDYHPPTIAIDSFYEERIVKRWLQALALLIRTKHTSYEARVVDIVERSDVHTVFLVLEQANRWVEDAALLERLFDHATHRHGQDARDIVAALRIQTFRQKIFKLRKTVMEPDRRFFLALLQNLPHREAIVEMVRAYDDSQDPHALIMTWVHALSGIDRIGVDFSGDLERSLFQALLQDCSEEDLLKNLRAEFGDRQVDAQSEAILLQAARMRQTLLAPLFERRGNS